VWYCWYVVVSDVTMLQESRSSLVHLKANADISFVFSSHIFFYGNKVEPRYPGDVLDESEAVVVILFRRLTPVNVEPSSCNLFL